MTTIKPYLYNWYDKLREGKITGMRCKKCGHVELPSVPVCNKCSSFDLEEVELSGYATVNAISLSALGIAPYRNEPVVCGTAVTDEGSEFMSWFPAYDHTNEDELRAMLPVRVRMVTRKIEEEHDIWWPVFEVVKENEEKKVEIIDAEGSGFSVEKLLSRIERVFDEKTDAPITKDSVLLTDLNMSSLTQFMLLAEVEEMLGKPVGYALIKECKTVEDVIKLCEDLSR